MKVGNICLNDWNLYSKGTLQKESSSHPAYDFIFIYIDHNPISAYAAGKFQILNKFISNREFNSEQEAKNFIDNLLIKFDNLKAFI